MRVDLEVEGGANTTPWRLGPALGGARSDVLCLRLMTIVRSVFFSLFCRSLRSPPHAP